MAVRSLSEVKQQLYVLVSGLVTATVRVKLLIDRSDIPRSVRLNLNSKYIKETSLAHNFLSNSLVKLH